MNWIISCAMPSPAYSSAIPRAKRHLCRSPKAAGVKHVETLGTKGDGSLIAHARVSPILTAAMRRARIPTVGLMISPAFSTPPAPRGVQKARC